MILAAAVNSPVITGVGFVLTAIVSAFIVIMSTRMFGVTGLLISSGLMTILVCIIAILYAGHG